MNATEKQIKYLKKLMHKCMEDDKIDALINAGLSTKSASELIGFYIEYLDYLKSCPMQIARIEAERLDEKYKAIIAKYEINLTK